ncbi:hypothetical protein VPNG_01850 [Cytospora leucostoma]|uniref:Uncharacterized protein n=1 Tax=Cytospora leucostoma TaxID=1230097 RepID=A0A423XIT0_9PEZI|nr:hypothetical protein VPNG_01850 [Cytospora leucostoma]
MSVIKLCWQLLLFLTINVVHGARRTSETVPMTQWPTSSGNLPTWYATSDLSRKPLTSWDELAGIANAHWNWVRSQDKAKSKQGTVLVASLWDPTSKTVYSSTIPRGDRRLAMYRDGPREAPTWYRQVKSVHPWAYYHAEDGCYYMYEKAHPSQVQNNRYSNGQFAGGMWLAVYGTYNIEKDKEGNAIELCGTSAIREPSCMTQANNLGIWYASGKNSDVQLTPDQEDELDDPDVAAGMADWKQKDASTPSQGSETQDFKGADNNLEDHHFFSNEYEDNPVYIHNSKDLVIQGTNVNYKQVSHASLFCVSLPFDSFRSIDRKAYTDQAIFPV